MDQWLSTSTGCASDHAMTSSNGQLAPQDSISSVQPLTELSPDAESRRDLRSTLLSTRRTSAVWKYSRQPNSTEPKSTKHYQRIWYCKTQDCCYHTHNLGNAESHLRVKYHIILEATNSPPRYWPGGSAQVIASCYALVSNPVPDCTVRWHISAPLQATVSGNTLREDGTYANQHKQGNMLWYGSFSTGHYLYRSTSGSAKVASHALTVHGSRARKCNVIPHVNACALSPRRSVRLWALLLLPMSAFHVAYVKCGTT
jgi:hypothetical protein